MPDPGYPPPISLEEQQRKRFALYPTLEAYLADLTAINQALGYPAKDGTQTYENPNPEPDEHGRYIMTVYDHVAEHISVEIVEVVPLIIEEPQPVTE